MKFFKLIRETYEQLELDFTIKKPKWALACGDKCDYILKKYYPIKNMPAGKRRDAAYRKFWKEVIYILKGKGFTPFKMQSLGVPEFMIYRDF